MRITVKKISKFLNWSVTLISQNIKKSSFLVVVLELYIYVYFKLTVMSKYCSFFKTQIKIFRNVWILLHFCHQNIA